MAQQAPDGSVTFDADEVKNLAAFVHGDDPLLEETNDLLQEVFDRSVDEVDQGEYEKEEEEEK